MAQLIPSLSTCLRSMTSGEKRFSRCLDKLLEDDYLCWYDIPLGSKRRYPDFVILHPSRGILFLEVKDWKASTIKKISHKHVEILTDTGLKTQSNPIEQARQCSYQVLHVFERDDQLKQVGGNYHGKLCFPYGYGVVFPNITRKQLDSAIPEEHRDRLLPSRLIICQDEMTPNTDAEEFQEQLWGMFNYQFGEKLTLPQIDRIRWHLFPEIRIDSGQQELFAPTANEIVPVESAIPDIVKIMDIQQEQLARSLGEGHRVVHGVAGSGKTLILGYRCLHLAETMNKPILVLCFNITLAARLRGFICEKGLTGRVQIYHFHGWCGDQLRTYNVDVIDSSAPVWERQVESVMKGVENNKIPRAQYGAVLIDEGHDFEPEWLSLVSQMVDPETNSLLLLYDDAQSIYKRKSSLKFSLASVGIQAQGRTTILRLNYRNTREILDFAYRFAQDYFSDSTGSDDMPLIHPEAAGKHGSKPYVRCLGSLQEETDYLVRCLQKWRETKSWRDIAVLYPTAKSGRAIFNALKSHNIPCSWLQSSQTKKAYDVDADKVSLMAIPSSKGLEFDTVAILDASFEVSKEDSGTVELSDDVRRLYVGFTRAKENLLVTYHRQTTLGKSLNLVSQALVSL